LNNDTVVPLDALTKLIAGALNGKIDVASPVIYYADEPNRIWFCNCNLDLANCTCVSTSDINTARAWQRERPNCVAVVGTAMLIRRAVTESVGILDERFFAYAEDIDYCIRSVHAGFRVALIFDSAVHHKKNPEGRIDSWKPHVCYFIARNEILMWRKYVSGARKFLMMLWHLKRVLWLIEGLAANPTEKQAFLAGIWDGWNNVSGPFDPTRRMPQPIRALVGSSFTQFIVAAARRRWHILKYAIQKD
jgi:hypothetical protein